MKDLPRKTASDKVLHDKAFTIAKTQYDDYQRGLASMVYNFFLIRSLQMVLLHMVRQRWQLCGILKINLLLKIKLCQTKNKMKNYIIPLLENLKNEKHTHLLKSIFGVWSCGYAIDK